jgi:pyridoxamine 5'-phosphate oxidase family protein
MATLSGRELTYLGTQRLGRLATLAPDGYPQNNPVGFFYNAELGTIDIGARGVARGRLYHPVRSTVGEC